ncbi:hypothetical protein D3C80_1358560 [compost metagenome]
MGVGVPAILAIGQFQRPDQALIAGGLLEAGPGRTLAQVLQRGLLLSQELRQLLPDVMGEGEGDHRRLQALGISPGHRLGHLFAAPLLDLRRADRARPNTAAVHHTTVESAAMLTRGVHTNGRRHWRPLALGCAVPVLRVQQTFPFPLVEEQGPCRCKEVIALSPVSLQLRTQVLGG